MSEAATNFAVRPSGGAWVGVERFGTEEVDVLTPRHRSPAAARRDLKRKLRGFMRQGLLAAMPAKIPEVP